MERRKIWKGKERRKEKRKIEEGKKKKEVRKWKRRKKIELVRRKTVGGKIVDSSFFIGRKTGQTLIGRQPQISTIVFANRINHIVRQTLLRSISLKYILVIFAPAKFKQAIAISTNPNATIIRLKNAIDSFVLRMTPIAC